MPSNDGYIKKSDTIDIEHFDCSEEDTEFKVVIDRVSAVTMKAPPSIGGQSVKAVIDTRAEVTVYVAQISDDVLSTCDIIDDLIAPSIQDRVSVADPEFIRS